MFVPVWLLITLAVLALLLVILVVASLGAWYGIYLEVEQLRANTKILQVDVYAAEARARGVGGTGEHQGVAVVPFDPVSRVGSMYRDPRFDIPGRGR